MTQVLIVIGVAGSGKTTVGKALAARLGWTFRDADDFHSAANKGRMSRGIPLTDDDRRPWLETIAAELARLVESGEHVVLACSGLKARYRAVLSRGGMTRFVLLDGDRETLVQRLAGRSGHFFDPRLLDSQLEALEPLAQPETGLVVDIRHDVAAIVDLVVRWME